MNRWILQMGFPVVTIDTQTGSISQQHFLIDPEAVDSIMTSDYKYVYPDNISSDRVMSYCFRTCIYCVCIFKNNCSYEWFVPITWMKSGSNMGQHWLLNKTASYESMKTDTDWVLANLNVTGFYMVNYDSQNWERLFTQLTSDHKVSISLHLIKLKHSAYSIYISFYTRRLFQFLTEARSSMMHLIWRGKLSSPETFNQWTYLICSK